MSDLSDKLNRKVQEKFLSVLDRAGLGGVVLLLGDGNYSWVTQFPQFTGLVTYPDGSVHFDSVGLGKLRRAIQVLETLCRATDDLHKLYTQLLYQARLQLSRQGLRVVEKVGSS